MKLFYIFPYRSLWYQVYFLHKTILVTDGLFTEKNLRSYDRIACIATIMIREAMTILVFFFFLLFLFLFFLLTITLEVISFFKSGWVETLTPFYYPHFFLKKKYWQAFSQIQWFSGVQRLTADIMSQLTWPRDTPTCWPGDSWLLSLITTKRYLWESNSQKHFSTHQGICIWDDPCS